MFKKLKSIFIIEDSSGKPASAAKETGRDGAEAEENDEILRSSVDHAMTDQEHGGEISEKFLNILLKALERNNAEGFDYLEYKNSLRSLDEMKMDEETRFKSAFAVAKTMGASHELLIKSADHYLKILDIEEKKFDEAFQSQRTKQIEERQNKINKLKALIKDKKIQIEKLEKEIAGHEQSAEGEEAHIREAEAKVENTKEDFYTTYKILVGQIREDIQKMNQYLA